MFNFSFVRTLAYILIAPFMLFECSGAFVFLFSFFPDMSMSCLLIQAVASVVLAGIGYALLVWADKAETEERDREEKVYASHILSRTRDYTLAPHTPSIVKQCRVRIIPMDEHTWMAYADRLCTPTAKKG